MIDPRRTREAVVAGIDFAWGSGPRVSRSAAPREDPHARRPTRAHLLSSSSDLDQAIADWRTILGELDPAQLEEPVVRVDRWEAGGDVMSSATFVNPDGCEIQLLCPLNDGPLGTRLAKRGEDVHHICFTTPDLPGAGGTAGRGRRRADEHGALTATRRCPWQYWTFISPELEPRPLVELAYPYRAVDGTWEPGEGAPAG